MFQLGNEPEKALLAYQRANMWRELFTLARSSGIVDDEAMNELAADVAGASWLSSPHPTCGTTSAELVLTSLHRRAESLSGKRRYDEAARVLLEYGDDVDGAVYYLCEGSLHSEAVRIVRRATLFTRAVRHSLTLPHPDRPPCTTASTSSTRASSPARSTCSSACSTTLATWRNSSTSRLRGWATSGASTRRTPVRSLSFLRWYWARLIEVLEQTTTSAWTTLLRRSRTSSSRQTACRTLARPSRGTPSTQRPRRAARGRPRALLCTRSASACTTPLTRPDVDDHSKTASSRRRAALKRAAGKKGTVYEELYLLNSIKKTAEVKLGEVQSPSLSPPSLPARSRVRHRALTSSFAPHAAETAALLPVLLTLSTTEHRSAALSLHGALSSLESRLSLALDAVWAPREAAWVAERIEEQRVRESGDPVRVAEWEARPRAVEGEEETRRVERPRLARERWRVGMLERGGEKVK